MKKRKQGSQSPQSQACAAGWETTLTAIDVQIHDHTWEIEDESNAVIKKSVKFIEEIYIQVVVADITVVNYGED